MKKLYVVRVEHSQTDHEFVATYATSFHEAQDKVEMHYPNAYYYSFAARVDRMLE
jgi:hypothetical protein